MLLDALLEVTVHFYSRGVTSSAEIEYELRTEAKLCSSCGSVLVTAETIRWFRRHYRDIILSALETALLDQSQTVHTAIPSSCVVSPHPTEARIRFARQVAIARLNEAIRRDSHDNDE
jgi:NMD protein affecting ribosome stability and mRNA decay